MTREGRRKKSLKKNWTFKASPIKGEFNPQEVFLLKYFCSILLSTRHFFAQPFPLFAQTFQLFHVDLASPFFNETFWMFILNDNQRCSASPLDRPISSLTISGFFISKHQAQHSCEADRKAILRNFRKSKCIINGQPTHRPVWSEVNNE